MYGVLLTPSHLSTRKKQGAYPLRPDLSGFLRPSVATATLYMKSTGSKDHLSAKQPLCLTHVPKNEVRQGSTITILIFNSVNILEV
jgi:hypothetical protein